VFCDDVCVEKEREKGEKTGQKTEGRNEARLGNEEVAATAGAWRIRGKL
jgi:hypothetical protein